MDDRVFHSEFEILKETPKRYQVKITRQMCNGNDWKKPFITITEETTISFKKLLNLQNQFCENATTVEIVTI